MSNEGLNRMSARFPLRARKAFRFALAAVPVLLAALLMLPVRPAKATFVGFCTDCGCEDTEMDNTQDYMKAEAELTRSRFQPEFDAFENWLVSDLFLSQKGPVCVSAGGPISPGTDSLPTSCPPPGGSDFPTNPVNDDPGGPVPSNPSDPLATGDTPTAADKKWLLPWWENMAQQITAAAEWQTMVFGTFLDAKQQVETQRLMQELAARAHKDYQPSFEICEYGTMIRSLAASERRAETNGFLASRFGQVRNTGSQDNTATEGQKSDRMDRLTQFRQRYCDPFDNGTGLTSANVLIGGMTLICKGTGSPPAAPNQWVDRDIDYAGVMERGLTLDLDFVTDTSDAKKTDDEQDLLALASNLYGGEVLYRLHEHVFHTEIHKELILDLRSIMAERSVAEASFYTIAGMKSPGTPAGAGGAGTTDSTQTVKYMNIILQDLGFTAADIALNESPDVLGKQPSYYAQMELFTKKLYQDPAFYTNLYDTPANVERKKVTLQAIGLMQDFDTLQSYLRTEMLLSQILELELIKVQKTVQDHVNSLRQSTTPLKL